MHSCHTTQYENEAYMLGKWGKMGLTRPHLSDSHGKIEIKEPKEAIEAPPGWRWEGDWDTSLLPMCVAVSIIWNTIGSQLVVNTGHCGAKVSKMHTLQAVRMTVA